MKNYQSVMKELREASGMSQKQVAEYLDIRQQVYSNYETGKRQLPIKHLIRLCGLYQVNADYFLHTCAMDSFTQIYVGLSIHEREAAAAYMQRLLNRKKKSLVP